MTRIASTRSTQRPRSEDANACAAPWKLVVMVAGRVWRATRSTASTASPSAWPGARLKDRVTAGSCPKWFRVSGPTVSSSRATASSGTSRPLAERT